MFSPYKLIDIAVLLFLFVRFMQSRRQNMKKREYILYSLTFLYITSVLWVTLMPIIVNLPNIFGGMHTAPNFTPFVDYIHEYGDYRTEALLNTIMFIPLGFLIPLYRNDGIVKTVLTGFLLSLMIETLQPFLSAYRVFDVTDLITNTFGALIGYLLYRVLEPVFRFFQ